MEKDVVMNKKVDVIIPVYKPDEQWKELITRLKSQTYPINRILVMNTEEQYWKKEYETWAENMKVVHIPKPEFDHGGTRHKAALLSDADYMLFMTQDAIPAHKELVEHLVRAMEQENGIGAAYARQLPAKDCTLAEQFTRKFNYPEEGRVKRKTDLPQLGIKTYFCSNVCAMYDREIYLKLGGFVTRTIFNEDMIFAGKLVQNGYGVAYAADARVVHSHNYSAMQQFHRNFDLAVSQAEHPEIFEGIRSEGEGIRLVKKTAGWLCKAGKFWLVIPLIWNSGWKYLGYLLGKRFQKLPEWLILKCTMNREYWKK